MLLRSRLIRLVRSSAHRPFRRNFSFKPSLARFTYHANDEPEYMVVEEPEIDMATLKIPYLNDKVQQEMYALYMSDPERWDLPAIAMEYKASLFRTKAIIYLMHQRYNLMKEKGLVVKLVKEGDKKPAIEFEIPEPNKSLFEKYKLDPTQEPAAILEAHNASQTDDSLKAKMSIEELKQVLTNLTEHEGRWQNVLDYHEHQQAIVDDLVEGGAKPMFRESTEEATAAFAERYKPKLLKDEEMEAEKASLIKQIAAETKAKIEPGIEQYIEKFGSSVQGNIDTSAAAAAAESPRRWKFAFRDLGKIAEVKKDADSVAKVFGKDGQVVPTMIRTRTGRMRKANPLEEMNLSWHAKPTFLDRAFNEEFEHLRSKLLDPLTNPDNEDHLTKDIIQAKSKKRAELKAQKSST